MEKQVVMADASKTEWIGVVVEVPEARPVADLRLTGEDGRDWAARLRGPVTLRLDDGADIRLITGGAELDAPVRSRSKGSWSELPEAATRAFEDLRPGPAYRLALEVRCIEGGDRVRVTGVAETGALSGDDRAGEWPSRGSTVRASRIRHESMVTTPGPEPAASRATAQSKATAAGLVLATVVFACVGVLTVSSGSVGLATACTVAAWLVFPVVGGLPLAQVWLGWSSVFPHAPRFTMVPDFHVASTEKGEAADVRRGAGGGIVVVYLLGQIPAVPFVLAQLGRGDGGDPDLLWISAGVSAVAMLVSVIHSARVSRRGVTLAKTLLGDPGRGWRRVQGVVRDGFVRRRVEVREVTRGAGKRRRQEAHMVGVHEGPAMVTLEVVDGSLSIETGGLVWASANQVRRADGDDDDRYVLVDEIGPGDRAVVFGADQPGSPILASTGPDSLVLYAGDDDPTARLKRGLMMVYAHRAAPAVAVALAMFLWWL